MHKHLAVKMGLISGKMMKKWLLIFFIAFSGFQAVSAQVAVIANPDVPVDEISKSELLDFYTGDAKSWNKEQGVIVFDLKQKGEIKDAFYDFLGKSPSRMKSIWMKKLLSGEGDPPESLKTEDDVVEKVKNTSGAVGFISNDKVTDDVKVLIVIEKEGG